MLTLLLATIFQTAELHKECLAQEANVLEQSGEAADVVARAVVAACIRKESVDKPGSIGASMTSEDRRALTLAIRDAYERRVLVSVTRARACRKSKLCSTKVVLE